MMKRRSFDSIMGSEEESAIDLTPMLDVVFIMLIFFIVTATFIREAGVEVNRPDANTADRKDKTTILIAIDADDGIWIDRHRVDARSVRANVERLHAENPQGGVIIQADKIATVKTFALVLDAVREVVPHDRISLATEQGN